MRAIIYSECLKSSKTTKGLQPAVLGRRGSGKSHAVKTAVHLLPKEAVYSATLSPKALFYKNPPEKTTFYMDDAVLPDDLVSLMKRKQTQFQECTTQGVVLDKKWVEMSIQKRMVFITTSVNSLGDEQLSDRALVIDIKNEKSDDLEFYRFENERRQKGLPEFPECEEVQLCRDMITFIRDHEFRVNLPALDFAYYSDRRLIGQTYDLMEASAILNFMNRDHQDDKGVIVVTATSDDLQNALDFDMFKCADKDTEERLLLSEKAFDMKVQGILKSGFREEISYTEKELATKTGTHPSTLKKYLYGHGNNAESFKEGQGLCGKVTWYKVDKQKDPSNDAVKNYITISIHEYSGIGSSFAWLPTQGNTP